MHCAKSGGRCPYGVHLLGLEGGRIKRHPRGFVSVVWHESNQASREQSPTEDQGLSSRFSNKDGFENNGKANWSTARAEAFGNQARLQAVDNTHVAKIRRGSGANGTEQQIGSNHTERNVSAVQGIRGK